MFSVLATLMSKPRQVAGQDVSIRTYYPCLGVLPPDHDPSLPGRLLPNPVPVEWDNKAGMSFLLKTTTVRGRIDEALREQYCLLQWPADEHAQMALVCTLTPGMKDFHHICKGWEERVIGLLTSELDRILTKDICTLSEVWPQFLRLGGEYLKDVDQEEVLVQVKTEESVVQLTGRNSVIEKLARHLSDISQRLEKELETSKRITSDKFSNLKPWQTAMLRALRFIQIINEKHPDLKVKFEGNGLYFEGLPGELHAAKLKMLEALNSMVSETMTMGSISMELIRNKATREFIVRQLDGIRLVWDASRVRTDVNIYAMKKEELQIGKTILKKHIIETVLDVDEATRYVFSSDKWTSLLKEFSGKRFEGKYIVRLAENTSHVSVVGTSDIFDTVVSQVTQFLSQNTCVEKFLKTPLGVARLMEKVLDKELDTIKAQHKDQGLGIELMLNPKKPGLVVKGTKEGLAAATAKLKQLIDNILQINHTVSKPGMPKYLSSKRGKGLLDILENRYEVSIEMADDSQDGCSSERGKRSSASDEGSASQTTEVVLPGGQKVTVMKGDITKQRVGAIVNAANKKLEHCGGIAKAIVDKGEFAELAKVSFILNKGELYKVSFRNNNNNLNRFIKR